MALVHTEHEPVHNYRTVHIDWLNRGATYLIQYLGQLV